MNTSTEAGLNRKRRSLPRPLLPAWLALTVVVFAAGSSSIGWLASVGEPVRWPVLFVLALVALVELGVQRARAYRPSVLHSLLAALLVVALLSAAWSVAPRLTVERVVSFGFVLLAAAAIDASCRGRLEQTRRIVAGITCGALAVGLAGFVLLPFERTTAAQPAGPETPWRYKGLGENPNTISMFLAVAMPLAIWLAVSARDRRARALWLACIVVFAATIALSGSRGALLAALAGAAVVSLAAPATRFPRLVLASATVAVFVACVGVTQIPQPLGFSAAARIAQQQAAESSAKGVVRATTVGTLSAELGRPGLKRRQLFATSGRLDAWRWALGQAHKRPALGYGFGTEQNVFVDRLYSFEGGLPENSFVGITLQLGIVGFLLLTASVVAAAVAAFGNVRALREAREARGLAAACAGAALAGLALTGGQSYLYSAGNVATISVWTTTMMVSGAALTWGGAASRART
jgi:O-antigen ligase